MNQASPNIIKPMTFLAPRPTYCVIDLAAIQYNLRRMQEITKTPVMAVVKANAYGHGALAVGRKVLEAGARWLGVAVANEGLELRQGGGGGQTLVLGCTPVHIA